MLSRNSEKDWVCINFGIFCARYRKRHFCAMYGKREGRRQVQRPASLASSRQRCLPSSPAVLPSPPTYLHSPLLFCLAQPFFATFYTFYLLRVSLAVLRKWPPPIFSCLWGWRTNRFKAIVTVIKELPSPPPPLQSSLFPSNPPPSQDSQDFSGNLCFFSRRNNEIKI